MERTIGVIGGMGPKATLDFFEKLIDSVDAPLDQAHPRVLVDSYAKIPDRTAYLLGRGEDPLPFLLDAMLGLVDSGATVLAMPCNTAHYFHPEMVKALRDVDPDEAVVFLHMIDEALDHLVRKGHTKMMLLSTEGTYRTGVYQERARKRGIAVHTPDSLTREGLMESIYRLKSGEMAFDRLFFEKIIEEAGVRDLGPLVLGCTELPIIFKRLGLSDHVIDPTGLLAKRTLEVAGIKPVDAG